MKLGDKIGIIPDNFIEIIKKEPPKLPTPSLPSRKEPPPVSRPEKKEEVCTLCIHFLLVLYMTKLYQTTQLEIFLGCLHCNV